jgi:hypothetical protein
VERIDGSVVLGPSRHHVRTALAERNWLVAEFHGLQTALVSVEPLGRQTSLHPRQICLVPLASEPRIIACVLPITGPNRRPRRVITRPSGRVNIVRVWLLKIGPAS